MSWHTKPSATTRVPKSTTPFVTAAHAARWTTEILPKYAVKHGALMPILHEVQHEHRHIPLQAMVEIAAFLEIHPSQVFDTVTFYEEFHTENLDRVRTRLGIEPHETTADGKFTLLTMECLGSCDTAPVALFGETLHENLTVAKLDALLDEAVANVSGSH